MRGQQPIDRILMGHVYLSTARPKARLRASRYLDIKIQMPSSVRSALKPGLQASVKSELYVRIPPAIYKRICRRSHKQQDETDTLKLGHVSITVNEKKDHRWESNAYYMMSVVRRYRNHTKETFQYLITKYEMDLIVANGLRDRKVIKRTSWWDDWWD